MMTVQTSLGLITDLTCGNLGKLAPVLQRTAQIAWWCALYLVKCLAVLEIDLLILDLNI